MENVRCLVIGLSVISISGSIVIGVFAYLIGSGSSLLGQQNVHLMAGSLLKGCLISVASFAILLGLMLLWKPDKYVKKEEDIRRGSGVY